jgi:iron-sulfur cluster protein
MVAEEIGLTHALRERGIDVLETDIGEYIVDIEGRGPSHITAPALHLNRRRIQELLNRHGHNLPDDDPAHLSHHIRDIVAEFLQDCDAGITGANAVIASSGRIVIVENEGNVSLGASHPRLHIAVTGLEKVVRDEAGALAILEVLAANATAQPLTAFSHFLAEPLPGQERHLVFVDHGRSAIAEDARYRDVLRCIRCGACMNNCPVYRAAGGLAYGSPYMGPIGAVISPLLWRDGRYSDLPFASSLCGACTDACPVGIPLHRMLLDLRADATAHAQAGSRKERAGWRAWASLYSRPRLAGPAAAVGRSAMRLVQGRLPGVSADARRLPPQQPARDPASLVPAAASEPVLPVTVEQSGASNLVDLFAARVAGLGVRVAPPAETWIAPGDLILDAAAGIAATGSVLLLHEQAALRPLLGAGRLIVRVDPATLVQYPSELAPHLGSANALILTGGSRTADIEKSLVRGIHGPREVIVQVTR